MIVSFVIYFCILTSIGIYFYHKNKNASDYIIGSRSLNYWVTAIATQASDMGSWLFLAFPAVIFTNGMFEFWAAIGLVTFMFLNWQFIAPKLRYETERYNALTLSTYFSNKFNDTSGLLRVISALITIYFFTVYLTAGIVGLGRLFEAAFSIDYSYGIVLGLLCGITYTLIGGFLAVAWCDMFQGIFLLAMIIFVPIYTYFVVGGIDAINLAASAKNISLSLFNSETSFFTAFALAAGWGLGYFGQPHILTNFMGIDDPKKISSAKWVGLTWQVMVLTSSAMIGVVGLAYFSQGITNPELIFVVMTKQLFSPFFAGFVLCAILAATLSTMDSHILVSGSTFAEDLYLQLFKKDATSVELMWISRAASLCISLVALYIALNSKSSVYNLVNYAWSGVGSAFGPLVITALYSKMVTREGAIAGMLVGAAVAGIWPYYGFTMLPLIPGFFAGLATNLSVSLLFKK